MPCRRPWEFPSACPFALVGICAHIPVGFCCSWRPDAPLAPVAIHGQMARWRPLQFPPACGVGAHWNLHPDVPLAPVGIYTHGAVPRNRDAVIAKSEP